MNNNTVTTSTSLLPPLWCLPKPPSGEQWHRTDWTQEMLPDGYRPYLLNETRRRGDEYSSIYKSVLHFESCSANLTGVIPRSEWWRTRRPLPFNYRLPHHGDACPVPPKTVVVPVSDPLAEVRAAYKAGKTVQEFWCTDNSWHDMEEPCWLLSPYRYRIKPEPRYVTLEPQDVPPGSMFRDNDGPIKHYGGFNTPITISHKGVTLKAYARDEITTFSWEQLKSKIEINRSIPLTGRWDTTAWEKCEKEGK